MQKVKVLDTFVRGTNAPIEIDVEDLYTYWKFDGVRKVKLIDDDGKSIRELPTIVALEKYDSILYGLNTVSEFLNSYSNVIGIPFKLVSGENIVLGKRMKKATRVELDGADYGNVGTPVLVVNPNAMQGYGNISNVLSADYMRSTGMFSKSGAYLPHTLIAEGVGTYIYDVYIAPRIKGRKNNLPVYLTKEEFVHSFIYMYAITMFNVKFKLTFAQYQSLKERMYTFIGGVKNLK